MYSRTIEPILKKYSKFPVIALLGPRQSGKTTISKKVFPNHTYISFEEIEMRNFAQNDPKRFLSVYENEYGIILDEFQYVPDILSYIQVDVDEKKRPGYFVLTGSQNFLANQAISQSLAGRVGILTLLPLSIHEMQENNLLDNVDETIFKGSYPRLYYEGFSPTELYPSYIQSYIERDVRQLTHVGDLNTFQRFIQLCAGRVGQLLNISSLANDCGINFQTAKHWISILEASYIIFLLQPYYNNFNKRLTKSPKLYFYDTGVLCSMLRITSSQMLALHPSRGNIFESFIISDLFKQYFNKGMRASLYFWRDLNGRYEVDCIVDEGILIFPVEIKSGETIAADYFKVLEEWNSISANNPSQGYVVYAGNQNQARSAGTIMNWKNAGTLIELIQKKLAP